MLFMACVPWFQPVLELTLFTGSMADYANGRTSLFWFWRFWRLCYVCARHCANARCHCGSGASWGGYVGRDCSVRFGMINEYFKVFFYSALPIFFNVTLHTQFWCPNTTEFCCNQYNLSLDRKNDELRHLAKLLIICRSDPLFWFRQNFIKVLWGSFSEPFGGLAPFARIFVREVKNATSERL